MAKFITGKELETTIYDIIYYAKKTLLIVSPYIKLDDYFKELFKHHLDNHELHIVLVFGKNEGAVSKSMSKSDFEFFKQFLNISIVYVPQLHAKYYGNETMGVITSINLYDYSFINNIEFGVCTENNLVSRLTSSHDQDAWTTCMKLANENEAVFIRRPYYQKQLLKSLLGKNYVKSEIVYDSTSTFYSGYSKRSGRKESKRMSDFQSEYETDFQQSVRPTREEVEANKPVNNRKVALTGYCIRTGARIEYNPNRPMSESAYKVWVQYGNPDFPENYCHSTGQKSFGKTSMRNPILKGKM